MSDPGGHDPGRAVEQLQAVPQAVGRRSAAGAIDRLAVQVVNGQRVAFHETY